MFHNYYTGKYTLLYKKKQYLLVKSRYCFYLGSIISFNAVLSSPSISISVKAGMHIRSIPPGATNPLAMAIALIAWF